MESIARATFKIKVETWTRALEFNLTCYGGLQSSAENCEYIRDELCIYRAVTRKLVTVIVHYHHYQSFGCFCREDEESDRLRSRIEIYYYVSNLYIYLTDINIVLSRYFSIICKSLPHQVITKL